MRDFGPVKARGHVNAAKAYMRALTTFGKPYACTCLNGKSADKGETGSDIHLCRPEDDGLEKCKSCNEGFVLDEFANCVAESPKHDDTDVCKCPNGIPSTGHNCKKKGEVGYDEFQCDFCNVGYTNALSDIKIFV